jgi:uncharacterized protein (DUF169 family)
MTATKIKKRAKNISQSVPFKLPPMGWYFSPDKPPDVIEFEADIWRCMFSHINDVGGGTKLAFSDGKMGCDGAACYLGFKEVNPGAGKFLAEKERFKLNVSLGKEFYDQIQPIPTQDKYLILAPIEDISDDVCIEVVVLWVNALSLSGLVTLANFDRSSNDNVVIPFASGCQSIWTIPYKEKRIKSPKAVVGCLDPAMRKHISPDTISFSLPSERFLEMSEYIPDSFLMKENWINLTV